MALILLLDLRDPVKWEVSFPQRTSRSLMLPGLLCSSFNELQVTLEAAGTQMTIIIGREQLFPAPNTLHLKSSQS